MQLPYGAGEQPPDQPLLGGKDYDFPGQAQADEINKEEQRPTQGEPDRKDPLRQPGAQQQQGCGRDGQEAVQMRQQFYLE